MSEFNSIPRTKSIIGINIACQGVPLIEHALELDGATGWAILPRSEAGQYLVGDPDGDGDFDVLLFRADRGKVYALLKKWLSREDYKAWDRRRSELPDRKLAFERKWRGDPAPLSLSGPVFADYENCLIDNRIELRLDANRNSATANIVFIPAVQASALQAMLVSAGITGWAIAAPADIARFLPDGFKLPEVRLTPASPRPERSLLVLVSRLTQTQVDALRAQIADPGSSICRYLDQISRDALRREAWEKAWDRDPPPISPRVKKG